MLPVVPDAGKKTVIADLFERDALQGHHGLPAVLVSIHQLPRAGFFAAALVNGIAQKQQYRLALGKFHGLVDRVPESFLLFLEDETDFLRDLADLLLISLHFHRKLIIVGVADGLEEKVLIPCLLFSVENQADLLQLLDLVQLL